MPTVRSSSVHQVGRFAAGFGYVGISAVHAVWQMIAIGNDGHKIPLRLKKRSYEPPQKPLVLANAGNREDLMISNNAAAKLRGIMEATTRRGTAGFAFRRGKYRKLRNLVSGKTGTLSGKAPKGVTTWFAGMMPNENPDIAVAAVVVLEDIWHIKGANLAAEAFVAFQEWQNKLRKERVAAIPKAAAHQ